jgi:hypothetical protein
MKFTDHLGIDWEPLVTTLAVIKASRESNITLAALMSHEINLSAILELLWFSCERQARLRKISHDEFFEKHIALDSIKEALEAIVAEITKAFGSILQTTEKEGDGVKGPLDR